ncbi:MAG: hypothetical protein OEV30_02160 [Ignavibacteria bacterium]|nr:hypothetical protein [Ignavibacteria bacterium]
MSRAAIIPRESIEVLGRYLPDRDYRASLYRVRFHDTEFILKDFSSESGTILRMLGRFFAWRESCAYRRLGGIPGIPRFHGRVGRHAILIELLDGTNSDELGPGCVGEVFFEETRRCLDAILDRGVIHYDMGHNIIVRDDGSPGIIDFELHGFLPSWPRWLHDRLRKGVVEQYDRELLRIKSRLRPDLLSESDKSAFSKPLMFDNMMHRMRRIMKMTTIGITSNLKWQKSSGDQNSSTDR